MKSCEQFVASQSEYFIYSPSVTAKHTFFYPIVTGLFFYESGYRLHRNSYDSFLLMYIRSGNLTVNYQDKEETVSAGSFILLDCYEPHGYYTDSGWECLWVHFDGPMARSYYSLVTSHLGNIFTLTDPLPAVFKMQQIYETFKNGTQIREVLLSKQLSDILTTFLLFNPVQASVYNHSEAIEESMAYINEHFADNITVEELAEHAMISPYYFIRIFKNETGFTPHEYIVSVRINTAKYLLKNTRLTIKNIGFQTGFSCESVFCSAFKKHVGITPAAFRANP